VGSSFTLTLDENPLAEFVELPEDALEGGLLFSNVLCGVLRGALEMVFGTPRLIGGIHQQPSVFFRFRCKSKLTSSRTC
jgi:hypothetical protein